VLEHSSKRFLETLQVRWVLGIAIDCRMDNGFRELFQARQQNL